MATRAAAAAAAEEHILGAAVDELLDVGGDGFTMQGVAKRADVALRTLYNYFPTRDELLAATFGRLADHTRALVIDVEAAPGSHADQLRSFVEQVYRSFEDEGDSLTTLLALRGIPSLDEAVSEIRSWRREQLKTLLRAIDDEHGLAIPVAEAEALAFVMTSHATWHSIAVQSGLGTAVAQRLATDALLLTIGAASPNGENESAPRRNNTKGTRKR
jgi:AcrR family transcriptional regulator